MANGCEALFNWSTRMMEANFLNIVCWSPEMEIYPFSGDSNGFFPALFG